MCSRLSGESPRPLLCVPAAPRASPGTSHDAFWAHRAGPLGALFYSLCSFKTAVGVKHLSLVMFNSRSSFALLLLLYYSGLRVFFG